MKYEVPQGSVLGPLLFLIYINDLHNAIKFSTVHHFADDTNPLVSNSCIKKIQDQINLDLKYLCKWLKANKISLNASNILTVLAFSLIFSMVFVLYGPLLTFSLYSVSVFTTRWMLVVRPGLLHWISQRHLIRFGMLDCSTS